MEIDLLLVFAGGVQFELLGRPFDQFDRVGGAFCQIFCHHVIPDDLLYEALLYIKYDIRRPSGAARPIPGAYRLCEEPSYSGHPTPTAC